MAVKELLIKLIFGKDIHKDLTIAEKEAHEVQDKYDNACLAISVLEKRQGSLSQSLEKSMQELASLQSEKEAIDTLLVQLFKDEYFVVGKTILEDRLKDKEIQLTDLEEKIFSSLEERKMILSQLGNLEDEKKSLENDNNILSGDVEKLKEASKQKEGIENLLSQRRKIRDNLSTLKNEWQETVDSFKERIADADNKKVLEGLKRELKDYERRIENALDISVK